eukprot:458691_1
MVPFKSAHLSIFLSTNVNVLKQAIHSTAGCETTHYINSTKSCITAYLACMPSKQQFAYGGTQNLGKRRTRDGGTQNYGRDGASKRRTRDLGKLLIYLMLCTKYEWADIAARFVEESFTRRVRWFVQHEEYKKYDTTKCVEGRIRDSFASSKT